MTEATVTPASDETVDLANLTDARITDTAGFTAALADLVEKAKRAVTEAKRSYGATDAYSAARALIRSFLILPTGFPDWSGNSDGYSVAVQNAEGPILSALGPEGKRRLDQAVRQQLRRKHLLPQIVDYCLVHTNGLGEELKGWQSGEEGRSKVLASPSKALVSEVRKHYRSADLKLPEGTPFAEVATTQTPRVDPTDPPSVLASLSEALGGLSKITPKHSTMGVLRTLSEISQALRDGKLNEISDRPQVIATLARISMVASITAEMIDPKTAEKITNEDKLALVAALFNAETDTIDS